MTVPKVTAMLLKIIKNVIVSARTRLGVWTENSMTENYANRTSFKSFYLLKVS